MARRGRLAVALREGVLAHLDAALCRRYRVRGVGAAAALDAVLPGGAAGGAAGVDARCDVGCDLIGELVVRPYVPLCWPCSFVDMGRSCETKASGREGYRLAHVTGARVATAGRAHALARPQAGWRGRTLCTIRKSCSPHVPGRAQGATCDGAGDMPRPRLRRGALLCGRWRWRRGCTPWRRPRASWPGRTSCATRRCPTATGSRCPRWRPTASSARGSWLLRCRY